MNKRPTTTSVARSGKLRVARRAFRSAVFRGFAVLLPPLMTVVILIWLVNTTRYYMLEPVRDAVRETLVLSLADIREEMPGAEPGKNTAEQAGIEYVRLDTGQWIPQEVYSVVQAAKASGPPPVAATDYYHRYVDLKYLNPYISIPVFLVLFVFVLYLLGKLMTAGIGGFFINWMESGVSRVPLVRNVYSAAKQISEFFFSKRKLESKRIVAVEFPRKGIWTVGYVTNEGLPEIRDAVREPITTVLIPYSPFHLTGSTIAVRKSEILELNMTFDQACEYIVSCGVVIPHQRLEKSSQTRSLDSGESLKD
jgi:uncharacterized membrane protein